jgi:hypothetical protein
MVVAWLAGSGLRMGFPDTDAVIVLDASVAKKHLRDQS